MLFRCTTFCMICVMLCFIVTFSAHRIQVAAMAALKEAAYDQR